MKIILVFFLSSVCVLSCKVRRFSGEAKTKEAAVVTEPVNADGISLAQYVSRCEEVLGPLPEEINCKAGVEIQRDGPFGSGVTRIKGEDVHFDTCGNPSYGVFPEESCSGKSYLISHEPNAKGTKTVSVCRYNQRGKGVNFVSAVIAHNPKNGGTCFFLFQKGTKYEESGFLPGPSSTNKELDKTWQTPAYITRDGLGTCVECHSAYPWIRNKYTAAKSESGEFLVPSAILESGMRAHNKDVKYWIVARKELADIKVKFRSMPEPAPAGDLWSPIVLNKETYSGKTSSFCMSCHDIGRLGFADVYAAAAVGFYPNSLAAELKNFDSTLLKRFHKSGSIVNSEHSKWPDIVWHHAPLQGMNLGKLSIVDWYKRISPSMALVGECATNPQSCGWISRFEPSDERNPMENLQEINLKDPKFSNKNFSLDSQAFE